MCNGLSIDPLQHNQLPRIKVTIGDLKELLEQWPATAEEIEPIRDALQIRYPTFPPPQVNFPSGPWGDQKPYWVHRSHLSINDKELVFQNLRLAGRTLDSEEEK